jgi:hypothetical protein
MLPTTVTTRQFTIWVENTSCGEESWQIRTTAAWLYPHLATSDTAGTTTFTIESDQLATGSYSEPLIVYGTADSWGLESAISRTVRVNLWVVDEIFHIHLPIVTRHR